MKTYFHKKELAYTGKELHSLFAYHNFNIQGDSAVAFIGPCFVDIPELVDQEDVKQKAFIKSAAMVHFIIEKFGLDLNQGVLRQRLYIAIIKEVLELLSPKTQIARHGDDLFINKGKLSVSIATLSPVSTMIHIGINCTTKDTPVKTSALHDLGITPAVFAKKVLERITTEELDMTLAACKVRGVQ